MSYDIWLESKPCEHCARRGSEPDCPDPTYNLTPIFHFALTGEDQPSPEVGIFEEVVLHKPTAAPRGLRVLTGKTGTESLPLLGDAIVRLCAPAHREHLLKLEPENRWGTLEDAVTVLQRLATLANEYPDNVWRVR